MATPVSRAGEGANIERNACALTRAGGASSPGGRGIDDSAALELFGAVEDRAGFFVQRLGREVGLTASLVLLRDGRRLRRAIA